MRDAEALLPAFGQGVIRSGAGERSDVAGVSQTIGWVVLLRCPRCGAGPVYQGMFTMLAACRGCGLRFEREPGYFIGSIYLSYFLTAALMIGGYFALERFTSLRPPALLMICAAIGVGVPILFFRHARLIWLGIDLYLDPPA